MDGTSSTPAKPGFRRTAQSSFEHPGRTFLLLFTLSLSLQGSYLTKIPVQYVRPHTNWELNAVAFSPWHQQNTSPSPFMISK